MLGRTKDALCGETAAEFTASPNRALYFEHRIVVLQSVLYDRETKPGSAVGAGPAWVRPIEAFGQSSEMLLIDPLAAVFHLKESRSPVGVPANGNSAAGWSVVNCIGNEVREHEARPGWRAATTQAWPQA